MKKKSNSQLFNTSAFRVTITNRFDKSISMSFCVFGRSFGHATKHIMMYFDKDFYQVSDCRVMYESEIIPLDNVQVINDCPWPIN